MAFQSGLMLMALCASVLFALWPQVDLWFAALFYNADFAGLFHGSGFVGRRNGELVALREVLQFAPFIIILAIAAAGVLRLAGNRNPYLPRLRKLAFLLCSVLLGPLLLVNLILKEYSGRARPLQITQFGGEKDFTPVWTFADQCASNCSFVSGEVSVAAWTAALALAAPARWRAPILALAAGFTALVALMRMSAGAHFFSDVVIAAILTHLITLGCYWALHLKQNNNEISQ